MRGVGQRRLALRLGAWSRQGSLITLRSHEMSTRPSLNDKDNRSEGAITLGEAISKPRVGDAPGWGQNGPICWKCKGTGIKPSRKKVEIEESCPVCLGQGCLPRKKLRESKHRPPRPLPPGYVVPGPTCAENEIEIDEASEELCSLLGHWRILQSLKGGHRWSTDDLLTAWVACKESSQRDMRYHLDLGCGIGTVLLMTSWFYDHSIGVGVEAQATSAAKARKSIRFNGAEERLSVVESDFRECGSEKLGRDDFDLVTGTPPYFPIEYTTGGEAVPMYGGMPTFEQSAPARYEFRGGIAEYIQTASRFVKRPDGVIVVCEGNLASRPNHLTRVRNAAETCQVRLVRTVMVHGREDKPALFAVHVFRPSECELTEFIEDRFDVRHVGGKRTQQYLDMCLEMGIAPFTEETDDDVEEGS